MKIRFKHDIANEVGNRSKDKQCTQSLKGLENMLTLFFVLNQRPLKDWATLRCLFLFWKILVSKIASLAHQTSGPVMGHHPTHWLPFGF